MKEVNEIGSVFWLSENQINLELKELDCSSIIDTHDNGKKICTASGRSATSHLLKNIKTNNVALLPNFTCHSVISPFTDQGYDIHFYRIAKDLTVDIKDLLGKMKKYNPGILYLQDYFGFDTIASLKEYHKEIKSYNSIIIKDFTQSWLSDFDSDIADYKVGSLRKWLEIPDGGLLLAEEDKSLPLIDNNENSDIVTLFIKGSKLKNEYFKSGDIKIKAKYQPIYEEIANIFENDKEIYDISKLSKNIIATTQFEDIKLIRRSNYSVLLEGLRMSPTVTPVFITLEDSVTPLYFTVYVKEDRAKLQRMLAQHEIYCPVIWPTPLEVQTYFNNDESLSHFNNILSIPCDQRYDNMDMKRIVECIDKF